MKKVKKLLSILLVAVMLVCIAPTTELGIKASAAGGVAAKLEAIRQVYPSGSYFTTDGNAYNYDTGSKCYLRNIPSRGGLTSGAEAANVMGDAWSCVAFAKYVFYNIFKTSSKSEISLSNAKIGDYVEFSGHAGIYLSHDSAYVYVYDSNWQSPPQNKVGYNTAVPMSRFSKVYRASNYNEIDGSPDPGNIQFRNQSINNISFNSATISTWVSNVENNEIWSVGFFIGADPNNMELFVYSTHIYWTDFNCTYNISDYYGALSPGTTYYYKFYVVEANGFKYSESQLFSFTTAGSHTVSFGNVSSNNTTYRDTQISGWANNPNGYTIKSYGFYFGTDRTKLTRYEIGGNVSWTSFFIDTDVSKYFGNLIPETQYYFRLYCLTDAFNFSDIYLQLLLLQHPHHQETYNLEINQ